MTFVLGDQKPKKKCDAGQHDGDDLHEGAVVAVATKSTDSIKSALGASASGKLGTVGQLFTNPC